MCIHNDIHVIVGGNGGQMAGVAYAAFDIVFWSVTPSLNVTLSLTKFLEVTE